MAWCNNNINNNNIIVNNNNKPSNNNNNKILITPPCSSPTSKVACPSCGNPVPIQDHHQGGGVNDLPGLPAGVKFDPTDIEILEHLEAKIHSDFGKLHPLLDEFIPTIEGENGICYTHPEKLPGVSKDGVMRHFFHRPSKAYTTGTRKRRKVHTDDEEAGGETRWHKTGKTRPVLVEGLVKGFKKILVLYTNYGRQRKPEKTNWVMHQYHLGLNEDEKDGELVISKVFYQTQPRQCGSNLSSSSIAKETLGHHDHHHPHHLMIIKGPPSYYQPSDLIPYDNVARVERTENPPHLTPNLVVQGDGSSSFVHLAATK